MSIDPSITTEIAVVATVEQSVSFAGALHMEETFTSEAILSSGDYAPRRVTWLTGNNAMFASNGKTPLPAAAGFFIDKPGEDEPFPEDYELLDAMELLCAQNKAREVVVEHPVSDGKPRRESCWQLMTASLFIVCEGVPDERAMRGDAAFRLGVAYAPYRGQDASGKTLASELHFMAFIQELMNAGYNGVFQFKFSSYIVPWMLKCFGAQTYVLRFVNKLRERMGEQRGLPFYACALPVRCSINTDTAGREANKQKQVYYPVPIVPRLSVDDSRAAMEYLERVRIMPEQALIVEDGDRVATTRQWSIDFSARLIAGNVIDEALVPPNSDETAAFTDADIPENMR